MFYLFLSHSEMKTVIWSHSFGLTVSHLYHLHSFIHFWFQAQSFLHPGSKNNNKHNIWQNELHNTETGVWRHLKKTVKEQRVNWWICIVLPRPQSPEQALEPAGPPESVWWCSWLSLTSLDNRQETWAVWLDWWLSSARWCCWSVSIVHVQYDGLDIQLWHIWKSWVLMV